MIKRGLPSIAKAALLSSTMTFSLACGAQPLVAFSWSVPGGAGESFPVDVPADGTLGVEASWTNTATDVDLYVTSGPCADLADLVYGRCDVRRAATQLDRCPERVDLNVTADSYDIWILNTGNTGDALIEGTVTFPVTP